MQLNTFPINLLHTHGQDSILSIPMTDLYHYIYLHVSSDHLPTELSPNLQI